MDRIKIIECPRDAWQGLPKVIPTEAKVAYLNKLIELGFRRLDAVSFVAPKYVPQMADSEAVMRELGTPSSEREIIGVVVNEKGFERAIATPGVTTIGYPYSISANFRRANANMSKSESQALVERLQRSVGGANGSGRGLLVYVSMAFGNNYGEPWGPEIVEEAVLWLREIGVKAVSLADTIGTAEPHEVGDLFSAVKGAAQEATGPGGIELGVHLHSRPEQAAEKVLAAYEAGCRRFDCALTGLGGCPFAGDDLVGNIPTEIVVSTLSACGAETGIEPWALLTAVEATQELRRLYSQ